MYEIELAIESLKYCEKVAVFTDPGQAVQFAKEERDYYERQSEKGKVTIRGGGEAIAVFYFGE